MGSDSTKLGVSGTVLRAVLIVINVLFVIFGVVMIGIGIWAIVEDMDFTYITGITIISAAGVLMAAGVITTAIAVIGIFGTLHQARPLLAIYAAVVILIIVVEVAAAVAAFVYRDVLIGFLRDRSLDAIGQYSIGNPNTMINTAVENLQGLFDCCGFDNASDWITQNPEIFTMVNIPPGCFECTIGETDCATFRNMTLNVSFNTTSLGCSELTSGQFTLYAYAIAGVALVFGILEIAGAVFAITLCSCITKARKDD